LVEICSNSLESARSAEKGGADRIELCAELEVGGVTPSYGTLKQVLKSLSIEVFVLIRPRSGNFTYSDSEFEVMKEDIIWCKEIGCRGIVSGVLNNDNTLDVERTRELIQLSGPLSFTFHRAFDWVKEPEEALKKLIDMGCSRVLTSGQQPTAYKGIKMLNHLHKYYGNHITLMPGGGINEDNITAFKQAGFPEIHFSASQPIQQLKATVPLAFNANLYDERYVRKTDATKVAELVALVK
jgi:copper homeostasis protein